MYNKPNKSRKKTIQIERVLTLDNVQTVQKKYRKERELVLRQQSVLNFTCSINEHFYYFLFVF